MIVIYCPKCGAQNDDNAKKCIRCSSPLLEETVESTANENNSIPPMQKKPYEPYQQTIEKSEPVQPPNSNSSGNPFPPYQQPYTGQPYQPPYQQPYGMPYAPFGGNVQLQPYSNTLAIVSLVLSIITCNIVPGLILSIFAMTQGSKYTTASSIGNYYDANSAAKLSKILSWVSIGFSIATIVVGILTFALVLSNPDLAYYSQYY